MGFDPRTLFHLSLGLAFSRFLRERFFPAYAARQRASLLLSETEKRTDHGI